MKPEIATLSPLEPMKEPPSTIIGEIFKGMKGVLTEDQIQDSPKRILLSPNDVKIWFEHLQVVRENRRRGAKKQLQHGERR